VASVSCIYGLGSPEYYRSISLQLELGQELKHKEITARLVEMRFERSDLLSRGKFRLTGNVLEIMTAGREVVIRIETENEGKKERIKKIFEYDFLTGKELGKLEQTLIYPAKHFVVPSPVMEKALQEIELELKKQLVFLRKSKKELEAQRLERRTKQDIEMMREVGYCNGIENYSRYLTGRSPGEAPETLMDYFLARHASQGDAGGSEDFLTVVDESHVTLPQLRAMFGGDYSRKKSLVDNGFRLPSAFDNRPLKFPEWEKKIGQIIFTSATPAEYELKNSFEASHLGKGGMRGDLKDKVSINNPSLALPLQKGENVGIVEQIIRPTGLIDPELEVKSAKGQVKDVLEEIKKITAKNERVLITTLTKKMAEDLAEFLKENKIKSEYLHSNVETLDRIRILENLRRGKFDVLVGVNLLREGLDLPEVSLVAILDADKEGFLRSETSLIQTIGRAARNVSGRVILYADQITGSMKRAIDETNRRRKIQLAYNKKHHITPKTIEKKIQSIVDHEIKPQITRDFTELESLEDIAGYLKQREKEMKDAARNLEFEKAMVIRDEISQLRKMQMK